MPSSTPTWSRVVQVAGSLHEFQVDDNQAVAAGHFLVEVPAPLRAKLDQAEANHANAAGLLAQAQARRGGPGGTPPRRAPQVGVAEANATNALAQLKRGDAYCQAGGLPGSALDDAARGRPADRGGAGRRAARPSRRPSAVSP